MSIRQWIAEHYRERVALNLPELNALTEAAVAAGTGGRRADPDLHRAAQRVAKARDRRLRAVERARTA
jgi:hypothetical protein